MKQFLLVFDRAQGRLVSCKAYHSRANALRARFAAERNNAANPDVEVVVLGAESQEALARTHARYFAEPESLYKRIEDESRRAAVG